MPVRFHPLTMPSPGPSNRPTVAKYNHSAVLGTLFAASPTLRSPRRRHKIPSPQRVDLEQGRRPGNSVLRHIRTCTGQCPTRRLKSALRRTHSASARNPPGKARPFAHHPRETQQDSALCFHRDRTKLRRTNVL